MTTQRLLWLHGKIAVAVVVAGLFGYRYWYVPRTLAAPNAAAVESPAAATTTTIIKPALAALAQPHAPAPSPAARGGQPAPSAPSSAPSRPALIRNGDFAAGLQAWSLWKEAHALSNQVSANEYNGHTLLRIENPTRKMIGVQQAVQAISGRVYRLGARVRSVATTDSAVIFGGRIAFYLPPQPEQQLVWMTECTDWWQRTMVFTNRVSGAATLYAHLGYGTAATTGEFTGITLEDVTERP